MCDTQSKTAITLHISDGLSQFELDARHVMCSKVDVRIAGLSTP